MHFSTMQLKISSHRTQDGLKCEQCYKPFPSQGKLRRNMMDRRDSRRGLHGAHVEKGLQNTNFSPPRKATSYRLLLTSVPSHCARHIISGCVFRSPIRYSLFLTFARKKKSQPSSELKCSRDKYKREKWGSILFFLRMQNSHRCESVHLRYTRSPS